MDKTKRIIAKKYAQAFVHSFSAHINKQVIAHLSELTGQEQKYTAFTSLLKLSTINDAIKQNAFTTIAQEYQLPNAFTVLFDLLIAHKRSDLWLMIIAEIITLYCKEQSIELTTISSSHELSPEQKHELVALFEQKSEKTVIPEFVVNQALIMGVRMLSTDFYLERSFKKYITDIKNSIHT